MGDKLNQWVIEKLNTHKMSMRELGRQAGIGQSAISKVLSGKRKAGMDFYIKIAEVFDAVPEMLQVAGVLPTEEGMRGSLLELFKAVRRLSPEQQKQFMDYGRFLVEQEKQREALDNSNLATGAGSAK